MAKFDDITNTVWGLGLQGYGYVVQGKSCLRQRIDMAIRTSQGSDPMRPEFGTTIYKRLDSPMNVAIPNIKNEIANAILNYVPEVTIQKLTHKVEMAKLFFYVTYLDKDGISDTMGYGVSDGVIAPIDTRLVLTALIPANPNNRNYKLGMVLNGGDAFPLAPTGGFVSIDDLMQWAQGNWNYLAGWQQTTTSVMAFVNDPVYTSGALTISVSEFARIAALLPALDVSEGYRIDLALDATTTVSAYKTFYTMGDLLSWCIGNWSGYGNWAIETSQGDFNGDFNSDFLLSKTELVLYTDTYTDAVITISIETITS
jgi:phage baseplate assembly protein W